MRQWAQVCPDQLYSEFGEIGHYRDEKKTTGIVRRIRRHVDYRSSTMPTENSVRAKNEVHATGMALILRDSYKSVKKANRNYGMGGPAQNAGPPQRIYQRSFRHRRREFGRVGCGFETNWTRLDLCQCPHNGFDLRYLFVLIG
ncbi:unnamed protein product [Nesidiocoris tenuis]|uniref:Uncharacterized protein n=1 Tax=Nesidiocoris tenuis TaxID=355587 RepID=A0A6H5HL65_9HEMI|nr:unnamed protein product [Nesidiocoris tenuis]